MLRRSFLPPISEYELAADLFSRAADALIANDLSLCDRLVREADLRPLRDFDYLISGPINPEIHRQSKNSTYPPIPKSELPRMPGAVVTRQVFARDGYRCRFCGSRVILKQAREKFSEALPEAARWGSTRDERHCGLATLLASIDHILPYKRGGNHEPSNLVTACTPCQFGRNRWTLEEVEIEDPRNYPPIVDDWDGLSRLVGFKPSNK